MNLVKLTEEIIKGIVEDAEGISVKEFETDDENFVHIEVLVAESDMPRVIGKAGKMANSIRTIVSASGRLHNKRVKINIDSF